jgi:hypothetical protein
MAQATGLEHVSRFSWERTTKGRSPPGYWREDAGGLKPLRVVSRVRR